MLGILGVLAPIVDKVLGAFLPDPQKRQEVIMQIFSQVQQSDLAQLKVNEAEASNQSVFVAGWRPAIGWCCAIAVFYTYIFVPFAMAAFQLYGKPIPKLPTMDNNLWELMFGMLGMAGLRSFEKVKGLVK